MGCASTPWAPGEQVDRAVSARSVLWGRSRSCYPDKMVSVSRAAVWHCCLVAGRPSAAAPASAELVLLTTGRTLAGERSLVRG